MAKESIVDRNHRIAKMAAERVVDRIEKIRVRLGVRPWEAPELTPEQSLAEFAAIVDDPEAWAQLRAAERQLFHLTEGREPKRLVQEVRQMYKRLKENGLPRGEEPVEDDVY